MLKKSILILVALMAAACATNKAITQNTHSYEYSGRSAMHFIKDTIYLERTLRQVRDTVYCETLRYKERSVFLRDTVCLIRIDTIVNTVMVETPTPYVPRGYRACAWILAAIACGLVFWAGYAVYQKTSSVGSLATTGFRILKKMIGL